MTIILFIFTFSHRFTFFIFFLQISYNIICACYAYMFCLQRWAVYICLSWNKYHVLFCSVNIWWYIMYSVVWTAKYRNCCFSSNTPPGSLKLRWLSTSYSTFVQGELIVSLYNLAWTYLSKKVPYVLATVHVLKQSNILLSYSCYNSTLLLALKLTFVIGFPETRGQKPMVIGHGHYLRKGKPSFLNNALLGLVQCIIAYRIFTRTAATCHAKDIYVWKDADYVKLEECSKCSLRFMW